VLSGKTVSLDHPSPESDKLIIHQNTRSFALSTRNGPKWSGCPFIPTEYTKNLYERQDIIGALGETHVKAQANLTDRTEMLKEVKIPSLVIHGEEDYCVNKYGGIQTAGCIENAELILIPKMGHIPFNYEILERVENEIIRFISKNKNCSD
jgi:pimeloyl-ACP methyl ester carboxylesterase